MNTKVSPETEQYLADLEAGKIDPNKPYHANPDALDRLIDAGLAIEQLYFNQKLDLMLILLNNKRVLSFPISMSKRLAGATEAQLYNYEISRTGVHWDEIDEDLSLKGFLRDLVNKVLRPEAA